MTHLPTTDGQEPRAAHVPVPALERALRLLLALARSPDALTLAELSGAIGVSRSTVYSLLATLQDYGFVEKDPRHKTYRLGIASIELGSAYLSKVDLVQSFDEVAKRLVARCSETVKLAVLDGRDVVYLGRQQGLHSVQLVARVGSRMPAHATAVGKVLLAALDDGEIAQLYAGQQLRALAPNTAGDLPTLLDRVAQARAAGVAFDDAESNPGAYCVAAPVRDHSDRVVAAMSIGIPRDRYSAERMGELAELVQEHALALSRQIGWRG
jgi:IclR family transcriptional regulator, KDG regulon repressor